MYMCESRDDAIQPVLHDAGTNHILVPDRCQIITTLGDLDRYQGTVKLF